MLSCDSGIQHTNTPSTHHQYRIRTYLVCISKCIDILTMSQPWRSQHLDQVLSCEASIIQEARDEVHHSVWCLLDVPHHARLSRLCPGATPAVLASSRPCEGCCFRFFVKISHVCIFIRTNRYHDISCKETGGSKLDCIPSENEVEG